MSAKTIQRGALTTAVAAKRRPRPLPSAAPVDPEALAQFVGDTQNRAPGHLAPDAPDIDPRKAKPASGGQVDSLPAELDSDRGATRTDPFTGAGEGAAGPGAPEADVAASAPDEATLAAAAADAADSGPDITPEQAGKTHKMITAALPEDLKVEFMSACIDQSVTVQSVLLDGVRAFIANPIQPPKDRSERTEKVNVRLPLDVYAAFRKACVRSRTTMTPALLAIVRAYVTNRETKHSEAE
jgi:hypothetical protein